MAVIYMTAFLIAIIVIVCSIMMGIIIVIDGVKAFGSWLHTKLGEAWFSLEPIPLQLFKWAAYIWFVISILNWLS